MILSSFLLRSHSHNNSARDHSYSVGSTGSLLHGQHREGALMHPPLMLVRKGWASRLSWVERCRTGLLLPTLNVYAHHEEPQHQRSFPEEAAGHVVGTDSLRAAVTDSSAKPNRKRQQRAQNSRQEGRPESEVVEQEAIESVKYHGDVHAPRIPSKSLKSESHEARDAASKQRLLFTGLKK